MNQRKVQQMMRQLGIQQVDVPATQVIIKSEDKEIIIYNPSVQKVNLMGQETFQVTGEIEEKELSAASEISEEDVKMVMEQTGRSAEQCRKAIEEHNGDLAEAIMELKKE